MPSAASIYYYLTHPDELRAIAQWKTWHMPVHERDESKESENLKKCFYYLNKTSRSFAMVIQELNPELLVPMSLFYLILRALDTIEDDMTIPIEKKEPILLDFHNIILKDGWTYSENGPDEKDRILLEDFKVVIEEFKLIKPAYRDIIIEITQRMGAGMAENARAVATNTVSINTIPEYEQYCHHVAGIVGEACTRMFVEGGLANPALLRRTDLYESMGQLLQQTNIIRDIHEDTLDQRRFWPKAIWSKHVSNYDDLIKPENREAALRCSSEMILNALQKVPDCMFYMAGLKDQSVFNFCAIPQAMAIATLDLCFRNGDMFEKNIKISKGQACQLMLDSSQNLQVVYEVFRKFARKIHKKNDPRDPNFLKISVACGKIEQFIETLYPSQDPKAIIRAANGGVEPGKENEPKKPKLSRGGHEEATNKEIAFMALATMGGIFFAGGIMLFVAYMMGARFDLAFSRILNGDFSKPDEGELMSMSAVAQAAAKSAAKGVAKGSQVIKETVVDATAAATRAVRGEL